MKNMGDLFCFLAQMGRPPVERPEPVAPQWWVVLIAIVGIIAFIYIWIIRNQRQQRELRKKLLSGIKENDYVVTAGGIHGMVVGVDDDTVVLLIDRAKDVKLRCEKNAVAAISVKREPKHEGMTNV